MRNVKKNVRWHNLANVAIADDEKFNELVLMIIIEFLFAKIKIEMTLHRKKAVKEEKRNKVESGGENDALLVRVPNMNYIEILSTVSRP